MPTKNQEKIKEKNTRYDSKRAGRTRNFGTVVYPESAPEDWMEILDSYHVMALISPLHDQDVNPDGEIKKPHYHVLLMFESPVEFEKAVKPIFDSIGGVGREIIHTCRGYARYLCHLDNPEKAQYRKEDVRSLGGACYSEIIGLPTDDIQTLKEIFAFIRENEIFSLAELLEICMIYHPDWFATIALSKAYIVEKYMKSLNWEYNSGYLRFEHRKQITQSKQKIVHDCAENAGSEQKVCLQTHAQTHANGLKCCPFCGSCEVKKNGKTPVNTERMRCKECGKSWVEE